MSSSYVRRLSAIIIVGCKLYTFQSSLLKPLDGLESNLAEIIIAWFSIEFVILVPIGNSTWLPGPIRHSDWMKFQRSSCQRLQCIWNCYVVRMILRGSIIRFVNLVPIENPRWPPRHDKVNIESYGKYEKCRFFTTI